MSQLPAKGKLMACPVCGHTVQQRDIFTGKHSRVCPGMIQALKDAEPTSFQEKRRSELRQDELAKKGMTFSERWADFVLESDFVRRWWAAAWASTMLLSWLVGYQTPNFGFWWTMATIPAVSLVCLWMFFNGRIRHFFRRGPVKRV